MDGNNKTKRREHQKSRDKNNTKKIMFTKILFWIVVIIYLKISIDEILEMIGEQNERERKWLIWKKKEKERRLHTQT